ncbi:MAG: hypothetical protein ACOH16_15050 [Propionibacteriaceae bacterium]
MNDALEAAGGRITKVVGTMWCAIAFALLALVSLPGALATGNLVTIISWIAQTFLQLVLLSVIMVGQDLQSRSTAKLIAETHDATLAELADIKEIAHALHVELKATHADVQGGTDASQG